MHDKEVRVTAQWSQEPDWERFAAALLALTLALSENDDADEEEAPR